MNIKKICVFCGSKSGNNPAFKEEALRLAGAIAGQGWELVYGGAKIGIMGILADEVMKRGANVTGVMVDSLAEREIAHRGVTRLYCVATMHERKKKMYDLSDAFVCFPGGLGTLDEFFEILTWKQLGLHDKPCALLNTQNYFDPLISFIDGAVQENFIKPRSHPLIHIEKDPALLMENLSQLLC